MRRKLVYLVLVLAMAVAGLGGQLVPAAHAAGNCYTVCTTPAGCTSPCCTFCCQTSSGLVCHHTECTC